MQRSHSLFSYHMFPQIYMRNSRSAVEEEILIQIIIADNKKYIIFAPLFGVNIDSGFYLLYNLTKERERI